jgi:hypothetical protein
VSTLTSKYMREFEIPFRTSLPDSPLIPRIIRKHHGRVLHSAPPHRSRARNMIATLAQEEYPNAHHNIYLYALVGALRSHEWHECSIIVTNLHNRKDIIDMMHTIERQLRPYAHDALSPAAQYLRREWSACARVLREEFPQELVPTAHWIIANQ